MLTGICLVWVLVTALVSSVGSADSHQSLRENYRELVRREATPEHPLPFLLSSDHDENYASATISYLLHNVEFDTLAERLGRPAEWCEFIPLHLNVKACTYLVKNGQRYLRFYLGAKEYTRPEDARLLELRFSTGLDQEGFSVSLYAETGPLRSTNIRFNLRALPIRERGRNGVYLEFEMSSTPGLAEGLASVYLSTIARNKVGFSIVGETWRGEPKYVRGQRAGLERNLVRYLLAIEIYFSTLSLGDEPSKYIRRAERWYDATDRYSKQLYEISRDDYLAAKSLERANQVRLQQQLSN